MKYICGIDEAGRGPIAGPVCAAAVVLPEDFPFEILKDSKKLTPKRREEVASIIKEKALYYAISFVNHKTIDKINILQASLLAMQKSYIRVQESFDLIDTVLVDGNKVFEALHPIEAIVKGDSLVPEIMAASILAKTSRDSLMLTLSSIYPQWKFETHKGYPTKEHLLLCSVHGRSPIHRTSFHISTLY